MNIQREDIEIMAPVGSLESLQAATQGGANSVYFGIEHLNMRARSSYNFTRKDLPKIIAISKENNLKTYLTVNTVIYNHELGMVREIVDLAKEYNVDAIIASDTAVLDYAFKQKVEVHLSTQLNISNLDSLKFYANFADVVVLARELDLTQVSDIYKGIQLEDIRGPKGERVKIEMFVHGALCMAISGKCYLSLHEHNHSANRGDCFQVCRRSYIVRDKERGNELEIDNEYAEAWMALAVMLYDNQSYEAAIEPLEKASTAYPEVDHLQKKLATSYMRTGKLEDAIARYKKVLAEKPDNINAYMNLANAYRVTGQEQQALKTLLKLKDIKPDLTRVYLRLAETYLAINDYPKAREMANFVIQQEPQNYEPHMILAQINFNLGYEKYEKFLWYEEEYKDKSKYYGEAADRLVEERDAVKVEAYNYFLEEEKNLNNAESMTNDPSILKDIRNKREILKQLKAATKPGSF